MSNILFQKYYASSTTININNDNDKWSWQNHDKNINNNAVMMIITMRTMIRLMMVVMKMKTALSLNMIIMICGLRFAIVLLYVHITYICIMYSITYIATYQIAFLNYVVLPFSIDVAVTVTDVIFPIFFSQITHFHTKHFVCHNLQA